MVLEHVNNLKWHLARRYQEIQGFNALTLVDKNLFCMWEGGYASQNACGSNVNFELPSLQTSAKLLSVVLKTEFVLVIGDDLDI